MTDVANTPQTSPPPMVDEQTGLMRSFDWFGHVPSWVLHRLGCFFLGSPKELNMPSDFYVQPADRHLLDTDELADPYDLPMRKMFGFGHVRLLGRPRLAIVMGVLGFVAISSTQVLLNTGGIIKKHWNSNSATVEWTDQERMDAQQKNPALAASCLSIRQSMSAMGGSIKAPDPVQGITFDQGCGPKPTAFELAARMAPQQGTYR